MNRMEAGKQLNLGYFERNCTWFTYNKYNKFDIPLLIWHFYVLDSNSRDE